MSYSEIKSKQVKPRKPHQCCWCAEVIFSGEISYYRAYIFDGDFRADYMHIECSTASKEYIRATPSIDLEDGWNPGDFARGSEKMKEY